MAKFVNATIENYTAEFKMDSGAEVSAFPSNFLTMPAKLDKVENLLTGPGNRMLHMLGGCSGGGRQASSSSMSLSRFPCLF